MVLSLEGKNPVSLFSGYLEFYCLTNARGSQPSLWEPSQQRSPVPSSGSLWALGRRCWCQGLALLAAVEMPQHPLRALTGMPCPSRSAPSASWGTWMLCCSATRTHSPSPQRRAPAGGFGNPWTWPQTLARLWLVERILHLPMSTPAAAFVPLARLPLGAGSRVDEACWPGEAGRASSHGFYCQYNFAQEFFEVRFSTLIS